jgi:hypothetical protein
LVFDRLFTQAEITTITPEDIRTYEASLKIYRDNYSVLETAKREREIEIARDMNKEDLSTEQIARISGLSKEQIEKL